MNLKSDNTGAKTVTVPFAADDVLAQQLRSAFADHGYDEKRIRERLRGADLHRLSPTTLPQMLAMTAAGTALDTLIRLFVLRARVSSEEAGRALAPAELSSLINAGVLRVAGSEVESLLRIRPHAGKLFAFDPSDTALRPDHVLGPGRASHELYNATVRLPFRRALDIGTGCGIQGISCAAHCQGIVCTDINPRALALARFNAQLNGVTRIEFREGRLFEPVANESFDLIVMNTPCAISPGVKFLFRDSGSDGDAFLQRLAGEASVHLLPGGFCIVTAQWGQTEDMPWRERLWRWFRELPLDIWVIRQHTQDVSNYVSRWIAETEQPGDMKRWKEWTDYLKAHRFEAVHDGIIVMRRRDESPGWFSITDDIATIGPAAGDDILTGFRLRDFLARFPDDAALLGHIYSASPGLRVTRTSEPSERGWKTSEITLRNHGGLPFVRKIDETTWEILQKLDGRRTLDEVIDLYATESRIDWPAVTEHMLAITRPLIEQGFLLPAAL